MKYLIILAAIFTFLGGKINGQEGISITGNIKNSSGEFIILSHVPRLRGNLNYDGFRSIGGIVDEVGNFSLRSESVVDGSLYFLEIADKYILIDLQAGDSIHLEFDLNDIDQTLFATGRGAGKVNLLRLDEFQHLQFADYDNIEIFISKLDEDYKSQLVLLDAVYQKNFAAPVISMSTNPFRIKEIIIRTPLSPIEYDFIKEQLLIRKFIIASFLKANGEILGLDSATNIFPYLQEAFTDDQYTVIKHLNHFSLANSLDDILEVEFAKHNLLESDVITYHDFSLIRRNPQYYKWIPGYVRDNFPKEVFDKCFADEIADLMSMGRPYLKKYEQFKNHYASQKYVNRLEKFHSFLTDGLEDPEYNLNDPDLSLDKEKFDAIVESYRGQAVYIIFWSAQYAGSSIINHLPLIQNLESIYDGKFKVIHICIDKKEYKNLWAARIIDNSWHGDHYFMPEEENEFTLKDFGNERISSFCYGGATYSFVHSDGTISKNIEAPMLLKDYIIKQIPD